MTSALLEVLSALSAGSMALLAFSARPAIAPAAFLAHAFLLGIGLQSLLLFSASLAAVPLTRAVVTSLDLAVIVLNGVLLGVFRSRWWGQKSVTPDRKSTRLNSSHIQKSRMPSSA